MASTTSPSNPDLPRQHPSSSSSSIHSLSLADDGAPFPDEPLSSAAAQNGGVSSKTVDEFLHLKNQLVKPLRMVWKLNLGDDEGFSFMKQRRISGWNFNEDGFELDPVFPTNKDEDPDVVKQVRFGGETVNQNRGGDSEASDSSSPGKVIDAQLGDQMKVCSETGDNDGGGEAEKGGGSEGRAEVVGSLLFLKKSLDAQRQSVRNMSSVFRWRRECGCEQRRTVDASD
ncbi:hypothetical protein RHMOL_Rhmol02G0037200 [Rhododendron molle]|uniref:Uncharacterized protein n=1 Tax=Rhododendron molle TaxID=49168 RepID=A0ACC0PML9_RHOML|nr:hypothetical protein RHMOL_Rhmol02G0037200 [Rhododendron molle]